MTEGDTSDGLESRRAAVDWAIARHSPFALGFWGALGVLVAWLLVQALAGARSVLILVVVSMFLAIGLNPAVEALVRRGLRRGAAVACVFSGVVLAFVAFGVVIAPPVVEQTSHLLDRVPGWLTQLQHNPTVTRLDSQFGVIGKVRDYVTSGQLGTDTFGGVLGVGLVVVGAVFSALTVLILTLYFLAALPSIERQAYRLVPASRRARVTSMGDEIVSSIGGYVSGALSIATIAGLSTWLFLSVLGVPYALALALIVAVTDLVPLIGATIGAAVVTLVALFDSLTAAAACVVFYVVYQQVENYLIYPRVMRRAVDVPPAATIVAALVGGALLGVVGALLAIPTAAAVLLVVREVVMKRQDQR
jgi:predicted PurR-regulated permease PerM